MKNLAEITLNQLAAQRHDATEAARERPLDATSVLYAVRVKLAEGRTEEAMQMVREWRATQVQG